MTLRGYITEFAGDKGIGDSLDNAAGTPSRGSIRPGPNFAYFGSGFLSPKLEENSKNILSFHLIAGDNAVANVDNPVRVPGNIVLVGDDHQRIAFGVQAVK